MASRNKIPIQIQTLVRERANYLCEYCHTNEKWQYVPFTMEHLLPISKGGSDDPENLCLACFHCNRRKSDLDSATDPETGNLVPLFNPRNDTWSTHFVWSHDKLRIIGLTSVGRATISKLELNRDRVIQIREDDILVNRHPPVGDPIIRKI